MLEWLSNCESEAIIWYFEWEAEAMWCSSWGFKLDDSMAPYCGRHSCKQFIRGKPIRFGYKLWILVSSTSLPYHVEIYKGNPQMQKISLLESALSKLPWKSATIRSTIVISSTTFSQGISCSLTWMLKDSEPLVPWGTIELENVH